ncbi:hypothetical protein IFO70_32690 [Phormidium tenue FACHB-886]|nr:hypothetical protein [Phormidium tenue FACHB-886]
MQLAKGDKVYYVGADRKIQQDYSAQQLTVIAADWATGRLVCEAENGRWLVGVCPADVQLLNRSVQEPCIHSRYLV